VVVHTANKHKIPRAKAGTPHQDNPMVPERYKKVMIEAVEPLINCGEFPIKRIVGDDIHITADIYKEGHDILAALVKYRKAGETEWQESPMQFMENDRWQGQFSVSQIGWHEYTLEAYAEKYLSWLDELNKKNRPGANIKSELLEGMAIVRLSANIASGDDRNSLSRIADQIEEAVTADDQETAILFAVSEKTKRLMAKYPDRSESAFYEPFMKVMVNRQEARLAAWYELFPRSQGTVNGVSGTFKDCERRLPDIHAMGFNVIYLPPIHPIGTTGRKGPNNSLVVGPNDPGCPYAIGNKEGGHTGLHPELGTFADFEHFVKSAADLGIEIALDFVMNCSPDHPYVSEHPEWFYHRPDGSIKFAENPPKKYEDVYPLNFASEDRQGLWQEMLNVLLFWIDKGVKIFRVDNPHTKPVAFWQWVITEVQNEHPDVIFLAEAFTRPKMMRMLAKAGFTQSYTYFTWRNSKDELTDYLTELTQSPMKEYFIGNLFANTPDILPTLLQIGGRPAFIMRAVLAATLSTVYGIYSGFELCENEAIEGKEEYFNSEKYEIKVRNWDAPGNIKSIISRINTIRKNQPALHGYANLKFLTVENPNMIGYYKMTPDRSDIIVVLVNLDPFHTQESFIHLPLDIFGIGFDALYQAHDLLNQEWFLWRGSRQFVSLPLNTKQAHIIKIRKWVNYENGFDYFM
jgi:starch synthase (maltosyl-transferring)